MSAQLQPAVERDGSGEKSLICPPATSGTPLTADAKQLRRLLEVIEAEILPKTEKNVAEGNKVFGAAILRDDESMSTVIAESNHEMLSPLYHGEIYTIEQWAKMPAEDRPAPSECVFLATHEPCCLCISGITWSGFKKCYFLYPYETTKAQGIPHDLNIMYNLWQVPRYNARNMFISTAGIYEEIEKCSEADKAELKATASRITQKYDELAAKYHAEKVANPNNKLAFN